MIVILLTWSPKRSLHYTLLNFKGVIQGGCGGVVSKKIEIVLLICATHNELPTIKMTTIIAICHNRVCADCGQPENECALEITEQDKLVCCDCLYPEEEEEDTCECCGKPYDDRSNHYLWEMCDCVQNDDGTLSRPEEEDDASSVNTQEECCECDLTEKQYNQKKGYEENLSTLHYIGGKTYCPDCREPCENSDDDEVSVCEACGVPETDECRPDCAYQARRQREEEEEHRQRTE